MSAAAVSLHHLSDINMDDSLTIQPVNPKPYLQELTGKVVNVRLKWGLQYRGYLISTDGFMNLQVRPLKATALSSNSGQWSGQD
jgi:hypothetical protein